MHTARVDEWLDKIRGMASKDDDSEYNEMCEYCGQWYESADLHYVRLTLQSGGKVVNRCEACRLDMKLYVVSK